MLVRIPEQKILGKIGGRTLEKNDEEILGAFFAGILDGLPEEILRGLPDRVLVKMSEENFGGIAEGIPGEIRCSF